MKILTGSYVIAWIFLIIAIAQVFVQEAIPARMLIAFAFLFASNVLHALNEVVQNTRPK